MSRSPRPLVVEVMRGPIVESRHAVRAAAVDADGKLMAAFGDVDEPVFPRSAIKIMQALSLVETGAADAFDLGSEQLALACASHSGEPKHTERVAAWLAKLGLSAADLECGPQWPKPDEAVHALVRAGLSPTAIHNNCSGKHTGMLAQARHMGEPTRGYTASDHPVQRRVLATIAALCDLAADKIVLGTDGCSLPAVALPLQRFARGLAQIAAPVKQPANRAEASRRLIAAKIAHPDLVAGTGRFDTAFMPAMQGRVASKSGAEGVWVAMLPDRGIGIAVKAEDGAGRAAEIGLIAFLDRIGLLDAEARERLRPLAHPSIRNWAGRLVGEMRPATAPGF
ncbi:asparaginase [Desertibaculum subflavum]|uniref:asparaginase n=1 Tax=Desertibaculum subflavum TaxID=2268458 RepID=UPI000E674DE9